MSNHKENSKVVALVSFVTILICGIWIGAWFVASQDISIIKKMTTQPLSDVFNSVNALFAGLAFGGVIITIYLQIGELQDTRRELKSTAEANQKMAHRADEKFILDLFKHIVVNIFKLLKMIHKKYFFRVWLVKNIVIFLLADYSQQKRLVFRKKIQKRFIILWVLKSLLS